ncbi:MAG TPA: RnfABCDGE type electron transport complex subunit D [Candidatus Paceibacterota bacterium]|nr:RnfABCDGE type electron transport complex subunit D [Candidatus Paceibacterota bacterium]
MLRLIDDFLNRITMYRLALYYLLALIGIAAIFGAIGWMPYAPLPLIASALIITGICLLANRIFAAAFGAPANAESVYITALILALIISPISLAPFDWGGFAFLAWASVFAMASKYILAANRKHLFNPAAIAVVITAFTLNQYASWWIGGNLPMMAFVVAGGLLIVRKLQRFDLVLAFLAAALASIVLTNLAFDPWTTVWKALIHTPLFFFASIMLTEPLTTPPTRQLRIAYGALVGALFSPAIHLGPVYATPELALVVGNLFSYAASPKKKYLLNLTAKTKTGEGTYDFAFATGQKFDFRPGQYMEWTVAPASPWPLLGGHDSRGNRRYFTIASSPTEPELHLGVKFYENSSSFKKRMLALKPGDAVMGGQLAGDFTLPKDPRTKLVFIAGGIGITPFRSMVKYLSDRREKRDVVLLYSNQTPEEISYREVFDEAARTIGLRTAYRNTATEGRMDAGFVTREVPDYRDRRFYISGTHGMVEAFKKTLAELGVPRRQVKTDFFPGF